MYASFVWLMSCLLDMCLVHLIDVLFAWCMLRSCDWCLVCLMCAWFVWWMSCILDMCLVRVIDDLFAWCMLGSCDWFNSWILIVYSVCGLSVALCGLIVADCLVNYSNYLNYARYVLQRCLFFSGVVVGALGQTPQCDDVDTAACRLLENSKPDLCTDPVLSQSACPRYCKLCRKYNIT